jgi:hypothetical protein
MMTCRRGMCATALICCAATSLQAQAQQEAAPAGQTPAQGQPKAEVSELAKKIQNPVSDLISVPFQDNLDYDIGSFDRVRNTLNIQPVIPIRVSESWTLVTRTIIPIVYQPKTQQEEGGTSGLGDLNPALMLSPAKPGRLVWGLGPAFLLPTATQRVTGQGRWAIGPQAVLVMQPAPWTLGLLVSNIWSFAGPGDRQDVNQLLVQYFVNYNLSKGWYLTSAPIITANWEAPSGGQWLVPFGGGLGKVHHVGRQPINGQISAYVNAVTPDGVPSPSWQLRVQLAFLFPK